MKKNHFFLIAIIVIIGLNSCSSTYQGFDDCHNTIMFENASQKTIWYMTTLKDGFLNYDPQDELIASDYRVRPGEKKKLKIGIALSCWEQTMKSADGYVYIYVYEDEYLATTPWQQAKNNPIKKYTLNASQLNKLKWVVTYPN